MDKLILSQTGVYRLHQLANQVRSTTGARYKLSDANARINLIRDCTASPHKETQTYLAAFIGELSPQQVEFLASLGVINAPMAKAS